MKRSLALMVAGTLLGCSGAAAQDIVIKVSLVDGNGVGKEIGTVTASAHPSGVLLTPDLSGLTPGPHGFHIHENPSCEAAEKDGAKVAALAAGGHYDPEKAGAHHGPYHKGHLGDLPALMVDADGRATIPVLAPRLKLAQLRNRALMIHAGSDNYSDTPAALGGGGARVACGLIK